MLVNIGESEFEVGSAELGDLRESNDVVDDLDALRERFSADGYLLIRGLQKRETVLSARPAFLLSISRTPSTRSGDAERLRDCV